MIELSILGVTHLSDLYPNVKYKMALISDQQNIKSHDVIYDLGKGGFYSSLGKFTFIAQLINQIKFLYGHLSVLLRFLLHRTDSVYVTYPGVFLVVFLSFLPNKIRPQIFLDAFISLYDTVVNDRNMLARNGWLAKLLYRLEHRAFSKSDHVLLDTVENAEYYSELFKLPIEKFVVLPLSIPDIAKVEETEGETKFTCLFVGSLVPLQGISEVLIAARRLAHIPDLEFIIIGDGQEGYKISEFLSKSDTKNVIWKKGFFSTEYIRQAMASADLCLGIFGASEKAKRVLPYKIYHYCALGKPFLTQKNTHFNGFLYGA